MLYEQIEQTMPWSRQAMLVLITSSMPLRRPSSTKGKLGERLNNCQHFRVFFWVLAVVSDDNMVKKTYMTSYEPISPPTLAKLENASESLRQRATMYVRPLAVSFLRSR